MLSFWVMYFSVSLPEVGNALRRWAKQLKSVLNCHNSHCLVFGWEWWVKSIDCETRGGSNFGYGSVRWVIFDILHLIVVTWLILPVVICLSQRLSHACLSINIFIQWNCVQLIISVIIYLMVPYYMDTRSNSRANTCVKSRLFGRDVFIRLKTNAGNCSFGDS